MQRAPRKKIKCNLCQEIKVLSIWFINKIYWLPKIRPYINHHLNHHPPKKRPYQLKQHHKGHLNFPAGFDAAFASGTEAFRLHSTLPTEKQQQVFRTGDKNDVAMETRCQNWRNIYICIYLNITNLNAALQKGSCDFCLLFGLFSM